MNNPVGSDFDWSSLYERYDATCKRFNPDAPYLSTMSEKPKNDRYLYYGLVKRVRDERSVNGNIGLGTYEAILYWKLYSQPAAVKNVCRRIHGDVSIQRIIQNTLQDLLYRLPQKVSQDISQIKQLYQLMEQSGGTLFGMADFCALPTRSTLLHFLYPNIVPIFDKQVLLAVGVTEKDANKKHDILFDYIQFAWGISKNPNIIPQKNWQEFPLRLLDMALWVIRHKK